MGNVRIETSEMRRHGRSEVTRTEENTRKMKKLVNLI